MNDSFFGRSGTMQKSLNMANQMSQFGGQSVQRLGALGGIIKTIMSLFI